MTRNDVQPASEVYRATCSCGKVVVERDADAANLPRENNRSIAESAVGAHEFTHEWRDETVEIERSWSS
ncbi:hypothetical protein [Halocalculus aciditolerans]|uniref:Uncharacterized protein n=1 Tax=Halocalculus aciditolerans TaxID=1383812 RepID=A0A830FGZ6_9EURY|nr:hypothetical protein [Halocalculus aciditolerans]GGL55002.1 hypothetical protein GCM10009039_11370 [Halocalculus aciditolerans]